MKTFSHVSLPVKGKPVERFYQQEELEQTHVALSTFSVNKLSLCHNNGPKLGPNIVINMKLLCSGNNFIVAMMYHGH